MSFLPNYAAVIESLLKNIDIENVHIDLGRSLCLRIAAFNHLSYEAWKIYHSIDISTIRSRLTDFQDQNITDLSTPATQNITTLEYDPSIWKNEPFDFTSLSNMSSDGILSLYKGFHEHHKLQYDLVSVNTTPPTQLVYELYMSYHNHRLATVTQTKPIVSPEQKNTTKNTPSLS